MPKDDNSIIDQLWSDAFNRWSDERAAAIFETCLPTIHEAPDAVSMEAKVNAATYLAAIRTHGVPVRFDVRVWTHGKTNALKDGDIAFDSYDSSIMPHGAHDVAKSHVCRFYGSRTISYLYAYVIFSENMFSLPIYLPQIKEPEPVFCFSDRAAKYDTQRLFTLLADYQINERYLDMRMRDATVFTQDITSFLHKALA